MKKIFLVAFVLILNFSCNSSKQISSKINYKSDIETILDTWHLAAANTDFNTYFELLANDAIFIGTDASENWNKEDFKTFSKPYFDKGKAWTFKALERHVFFNKEKNIVWFDEILDTQMELCRGSGVLEKTVNGWKIKHYVLSMTIPNQNATEVVKLKSAEENELKALKFNK